MTMKTTPVAQMRALTNEELDLVSGGKTVSYHDGFKFTLHDNGDLSISVGWVGVLLDSKGQVLETRQYM
jgi:hypothetical protein